jgi:hypothetical protein
MSTITFTVNDNDRDHIVEYNSSITCKEFILDYLKKFTDLVSLDTTVYTFKMGMKVLNSQKWLEKKLSDVIESGSTVRFIRKQGLHYSGGIDMADISNEKGLVRGNYNNQAPDWRTVTNGLNVRGKCQNINCRAYGESVDCKIGFGIFDLVRDCDQVRCPMCKEEIDPMTCIFAECQYKIEGKKKSNGKTDYVKTSWKKVEKDFEYYDPEKSGIVRWLMLIIETKPL